MAALYVMMIKTGEMSLSQVPPRWHDAVSQKL